MKGDTVISFDYYVSETTSKRKHGGRALCPRHQSCEYTDCRCIKPHWRGTHCSRDRRDECPTCMNLAPQQIKYKTKNLRIA